MYKVTWENMYTILQQPNAGVTNMSLSRRQWIIRIQTDTTASSIVRLQNCCIKVSLPTYIIKN